MVKLEDFKRCLEGSGYLFNETFRKGHESTYHIYKVSSQYGLVHFLKPPPGAIGFLPEESLTIELNGHLCFFVIFYDPTFQILSENPTAVPKILLKIEEDKHGCTQNLFKGITIFYLIVYHLKFFNFDFTVVIWM